MLFKAICFLEQPADSMTYDGVAILLRHAQPDSSDPSLILRSKDQYRSVTSPLLKGIDSLEIKRTPQPA